MIAQRIPWIALAAYLPVRLLGAEAVTPGPGPHLFADEFWIAEAENLERVLHHPEKLGRVIGPEFHARPPWMTVLRDSSSGRFRMWLNAAAPGSRTNRGNHVAYLESDDGLRWEGPPGLLFPIDGFGAAVLDEGPAFPNRRERFKLVWWIRGQGAPAYQAAGVCMAVSADGVKWIAHADNPTLPYYPPQHPKGSLGAADIVNLFRDPLQGVYRLNVKMWSLPGEPYRDSRTGPGIRLVGQSISRDFRRWSAPRRILAPDRQDSGVTEFYGISARPRGGLFLGMTKILRDDLAADPGGPVEGIGYTVLSLSRDGEHWERMREPFLDRDPRPETWDHAMAWIDTFLEVGDYTYLYYGGYALGHKIGIADRRGIGLARLRRDGYISRDAGEGQGRLLTRPMRLGGGSLTLNAAAAKGEIRVAVLQEDGAPIPGFALDDCQVVRSDSVSAPVRWRKPLSSLRGRKVRLRFILRQASLYGFDFQD